MIFLLTLFLLADLTNNSFQLWEIPLFKALITYITLDFIVLGVESVIKHVFYLHYHSFSLIQPIPLYLSQWGFTFLGI